MEDKVMESTVEEMGEIEEVSTEDEESKLRQNRIASCNREIGIILQKYGCTLDAYVTLRAGQVIPGIQIIPVELLQPKDQTA